jgi:hypothetical protein
MAQAIFGKASVDQRQLNPETQGGHITLVTGRDEEFPIFQRSLVLWEGPGQTQEPFNRRISEISSWVEPLNAKFAEFLAQFRKEEMVAITLGLTPVESECFRLWSHITAVAG